MANYAKFTAIVGKKKSGKTFFCKKAINSYISADENRRVLIIDTYHSENYQEYKAISMKNLLIWKKGVKVLVVSPFELDKALQLLIDNQINNLLVIIEDSGKYLQNTVSDTMGIYLRDVKNKGRETICVFHYFTDIPPRLFFLMDGIVIKKTNDTKVNVKRRTDNPLIMNTFLEVMDDKNEYISKYVSLS